MTKEERTQLRADIKTSERLRDEIDSRVKSGTALEAAAALQRLAALNGDIAVRLRRVPQV